MNNEFNFQPYTSPAKGAQKDGYALASLVLGIIAVLCTCCCCASALRGRLILQNPSNPERQRAKALAFCSSSFSDT